MLTHLTKFSILIGILIISGCDPNSYVTQKFYFKDEFTLSEVHAPSYKFTKKQNTHPIKITFPKQEEFKLQLSDNSCSGQYEATTKGKVTFHSTNCSPDCCETDWDLYIYTLIRKITRYEGGNDDELVLFIDDNNYLILKVASNTNASV
ncbi:hypothetical protein J1N10_14455 [Carboxylicivirga sp. A043]|uniref:hypothetical protein n=1 Tax=Carboxylicivirga litoralis TaxID=2816963 RepID=UPI0021CB0E23|nr:hypothetical protein [Carboxylicivirga sp. A043]MCU4157185.1 hypothetical protein [Carboxylicivirga sp. A043]